MADQFTTPVAFIIINRPETTKKVFDQIRKVRSQKLIIVADGPRTNEHDDIEKCTRFRTVVESIDWECQIYQNFASENMGGGLRPATGISLAFEHIDRAIILEDDCMPAFSFFHFCDELLENYANDGRIMHISGDNFLSPKKDGKYSLQFSMYSINWG